jgi:hypothetical protein
LLVAGVSRSNAAKGICSVDAMAHARRRACGHTSRFHRTGLDKSETGG